MKKTFKDLNTDELNSPAMAFITPSTEPKAKEVEATEPPAKPKAKAKVNKPETKPAQTLKEAKGLTYLYSLLYWKTLVK